MWSFKLKLVVWFALLALLPLAVAFYGYDTLAKRSETRRVDAGLTEALFPLELDGGRNSLAAPKPSTSRFTNGCSRSADGVEQKGYASRHDRHLAA